MCILYFFTGYYPPNSEELFDENSPGGDFDFLSELCTDWEDAANLSPDSNVRTVKIRTGNHTSEIDFVLRLWCMPQKFS